MRARRAGARENESTRRHRGNGAIQQFAQDNQDNHLALGIIYAHHGLLDEAERQLSSAATGKQSPELARKFLRDIKAMRR
jgi:hypothetical protein